MSDTNIIKLKCMKKKMEDKIEKSETKQEESKKNVLENGVYSIYGPESGDIEVDKIELHSDSGRKRIWKVSSLSEKEIIFKVEKFG